MFGIHEAIINTNLNHVRYPREYNQYTLTYGVFNIHEKIINVH
jgi:hypothetical protein